MTEEEKQAKTRELLDKLSLHSDDFPEAGGYPLQFLPLAYKTLGATDPSRVLHLCSGSVRVGVTVDLL